MIPPSNDAGARARRLLIEALRKRRRHLLWSCAGALVYLTTLLAVPLISRTAIDRVVARGRISSLWPMLVALVALGVLRSAGGALRKWQSGKLMALVGLYLRDALYRHFQRLSFAYHDRVGPGELLSRLSADATMIEESAAFVPFVAQSALLGLGGVAMLAILRPELAAAVVLTVALTAATSWRLASAMHPMARSLQDRLGGLSHFVEQQVRGMRVVKGQGLEPQGFAHADEIVRAVRGEATDLVRKRTWFVTSFTLGPAAALIVVVGFGGWLAARGSISPGVLVAFLQYLGMIVAPVMIGAHLLMVWPRAMASAGRIADVLAEHPDVTSPRPARPLPAGPATIVFDGVTFGYRPGVAVLDDLDLTIEGGTSVGLVGISGAGKTTIAHLVPRFYDPWSGQITLDGVPLETLALDDLRRAVAIVFEDNVILGGSIRENIALGRPTATDGEVHDAARRAHAHDFIGQLANGYETVVGERGMSLSGGQRQRIAIARALLADPRVLILDDATSAVDPRTDEAIRLGLAEVVRGRTTLIIAHRVETLTLVDRVVLMDRGRVVASGAHEQLIADPRYRRALALEDEDQEASA
jgi:ATP-binding cassette subfamily B protein